jgi:hypothetical protein
LDDELALPRALRLELATGYPKPDRRRIDAQLGCDLSERQPGVIGSLRLGVGHGTAFDGTISASNVIALSYVRQREVMPSRTVNTIMQQPDVNGLRTAVR